jgi:MFS family permease
MSSTKEALLTGEKEALSVDEVLEHAGSWGPFQSLLLLKCGAIQGAAAAHMLVPIFLIPRLMIDWDLSRGEAAALPGVFFAGYMLGVAFWAHISDSRGRRMALSIAFTLGNFAGIASFFAPSYLGFVALRFVCGFGIAGGKNGVFLLATEFATPSSRARVAVVLSYAWLGGLLYLIATAWLLQSVSWRWLVVLYTPALLVQFTLRLLPESPRFLLVVGEHERAKATLLSVFSANRLQPREPLTLRRPPPSSVSSVSTTGEERTAVSATFMQLWQRGSRVKTLVIGFTHAICTLVYYAINFDPRTNAAAGDLYLGALLGALVELPSYLLLAPLTNGLGRKKSYSAFLALSAACLLAQHLALLPPSPSPSPSPGAEGGDAAAPMPSDDAALEDGADVLTHPPHANWLAMLCALGGRFSSITALSVAYIIAAELFPTSCRNSAVGWATGCGRMGAIAAPNLMLSSPNPLLINAFLCTICTALVWLLPESAGVSLSDVPDDLRRGDVHGQEGKSSEGRPRAGEEQEASGGEGDGGGGRAPRC